MRVVPSGKGLIILSAFDLHAAKRRDLAQRNDPRRSRLDVGCRVGQRGSEIAMTSGNVVCGLDAIGMLVTYDSDTFG